MHLFKRGNIWWYDFSVDGVRVRRSSKTEDKRLAEDKAAFHNSALRKAAVHGPETVVTFSQAVEFYRKDGKDSRYLPALLAHFDNTLIKDITPPDIRKAAIDLYPKCSPATRNRQGIVPARAVINHAAESGLCPHIQVKKFAEERSPRKRAGSKSWIELFCANAKTPELAALARFMFETGTRISDAVNLTWDRVDLHERTAFFPKTKNGHEHTAMLPRETFLALANLPKDRKKVFGFHNRHSVTRKWKQTIEAAGITPLSRHEAGRHGFGTEMIVRNGVDIATTAKLGNWKSHRLLSETYAHPENERATLDKVFGGRK